MLPDVLKKLENNNKLDDNNFQSRPTESEISKIPSMFLPLDNGPVLVMPTLNLDVGIKQGIALTDRHCLRR